MDILLVDDSEDDIVLMQEAFAGSTHLRLAGMARDGEEALAYLRRKGAFKDAAAPDLVMLDVNLPKKNGFEVLQEVKADPALKHLLVAMMTVSEREEDLRRSYAYGACAYICKPQDFNKLMTMIRQFEAYWTEVSRLPSRGI
jgi:CheY-like chemotaxis protein